MESLVSLAPWLRSKVLSPLRIDRPSREMTRLAGMSSRDEWYNYRDDKDVERKRKPRENLQGCRKPLTAREQGHGRLRERSVRTGRGGRRSLVDNL